MRVGPAPTPGTPGTAVTPNSIAGNAVVAAQSPGTTYRLTSVPAVSRLNTQFTGPPLTTLRKSVQVTHSYTSYKTRCSAIVDFLVCDFVSCGMMLSVHQYILCLQYIFHSAHLNLGIYDTKMYVYYYFLFLNYLQIFNTLLFL